MIRSGYVKLVFLILAFLITACGGGATSARDMTDTPKPVVQTSDIQESVPATNTPHLAATTTNTSEPAPDTTTSTQETEKEETVKAAKNGKVLLNDEPRFPYEDYWSTDFSLHTIPYSEIFSGGVPRDGIPPIDTPNFVSAAEASDWLEDQEPVFVVTVNKETKAYPLQIIIWHEVVNDAIGGEPVVVTFCPLCNSAISFKRALNGTVLDFGVSGKLRNSDLIMWDRQTETWWQQLTGEAIVGELVGEQLTFIPTQLTSFADVKAAFPDAKILSRDTGFSRRYGQNPYTGYDSSPTPFLFAGEADKRLKAIARVVAVDLAGESVAYPYQFLAEEHVVADIINGQDVVVFWQAGTTSALDGASIANSEDVGSAAVFDPNLNGQRLSFNWDGTHFVDKETKSVWNIFGEVIEGELAGQKLKPVVHANHFWFAAAAFHPEIRVYSTKN